MAKKINVPRTQVSAKGDLIAVVQNGVEKHISKQDLLKYLDDSISQMASELSTVKRQITKRTLNTAAPKFNTTISAKHPVESRDLTTKQYVDSAMHNVIKNDGTTKLIKNLSYITSPDVFKEEDLVTKKFVDDELKSTLKAVKKEKGTSGYPKASAGESFIIEQDVSVFATDGPEVQAGDLIICVENSEGGEHGAVGHQFAIVNTNVVFSTEEKAGILKVATEQELLDLESEDSALTPYKYKRALELNSEYNRIEVTTPTYTLTESDRGIVGVQSQNHAVVLTLPSIGRLKNAKLVKYLIKDESNSAAKNTITVKTSGGDTVQGSRTFIMSTDGESAKLYNDGTGKWFLESNVSSASAGAGVKTFSTIDITNGERATTTGAYESVMAIDVDLREYPKGSGFKIISHCFFAGNGNTKTIAIGVNGTQVLPSSNTGTTAPNAQFCHHEITVLNSDTPQYMAFGFVLIGSDDSATGLTNTLELDWNSKITVSLDVNVATAVTDVKVYALQVVPLK
jgi:hypothetical protein